MKTICRSNEHRAWVLSALTVMFWTGGSVARGEPSVPEGAPQERSSEEPLVIPLNVASARELEGLPGIGPKRAEAIIALRERLGGFKHKRQLLRVRGIGRATYRKLRDLVRIGPPELAKARE